MTSDAQTLLQTLREHEPDWAVSWLIEHADPELWAPRQFIIVDELTKGSPSLAATWRAIYRLWLAYKPLNKRTFGLRMIASVGGVGRGHLGGKNGAIRTLHELTLINVVGVGDAPDDDARSDRWEYHIDPARLEALSIRLVRSRISAGQLVSTRRPFNAQQRDLFAALDLAPDDAILDLGGASAEDSASIQFPELAPNGATPHHELAPNGATQRHHLAPNGATTGPDINALRFLASDEATTLPGGHPSVSGVAPLGAISASGMAPNGATSRVELASGGATFDDQWHPMEPRSEGMTPTGAASRTQVAPHVAISPPSVPDRGGHATHDPSHLAPNGAPRSIERSIDSLREGGVAPHTLSEHAIAEMINRTLALQLPAVIEQVGEAIAARLRPTSVETQSSVTVTGGIPPAPEGEPPLPMSLQAIWEMVNDQPISEHDRVHIKMLVDRYSAAAKGYSEYWLGRVMLFAHMCRKDGEQIKLSRVNNYMKRMSGVTFSTDSLEDRNATSDKEDSTRAARSRVSARSGGKDAATVPLAAPVPPTPPVSRGSVLLPEEVASHWVITTWRAFAGTEPVITPERAQQLIEVITRQDIWEAVLTNWRSRYGAKANWTHFDGLSETYQREAAAKVATVTTAEFDPDGPPASASVIDKHPTLEGEERATWYRRFHAAQGKAEKQAVIKRMLAAHPYPVVEPNNK